MADLKVFISDSFDPYLNLAIEEWIFHHLNPDQQILFLWRNQNTVVIGRNQNPWTECNLEKMKQENVHLVRRTTGGGAVFQDLGNSIFTFMSPKNSYSRSNNLSIVLQTLKKNWGIIGQASGRNDLIVPDSEGGRKFSGSAFREKTDRAFHHGTLLLNANLTRLAEFLTPHPKKMQAKGKASVRSRVMNLNEISAEISHEQFVDHCIQEFESFYNQKAEIQNIDLDQLRLIPELQQQYELLKSWDWIFGRTLPFNIQIEEYVALGFFDIRLQVEEAIIKDVQIFSDCLFPQLVDDLRFQLQGKTFQSKTIDPVFQALHVKYPDLEKELQELESKLKEEIEV